MIKFVSYCRVFVMVFSSFNLSAQDSLFQRETSLKDVTDFFKKKESPEVKTTSPHFTFVPAAGYSLQTGFAAVASANLAFKLGEKTESKVSSMMSSFTYSQYNQTILPLAANIWSKNGKWNYTSDFRYMSYPSQTWGLSGRNDPNNNGYTINFNYLKIHQLILRSVAKNWFIGSGFYYDNFWNIKESDADGNPLSPQVETNLRSQGLSGDQEVAFSLPFRILYDSRLNQINPNNGFYLSITYRKNFKAFGGNNKDWRSVVIDARKYFKVTKSGNVLALWFYSWRNEPNTPYLMLPSLGWDDNFNTGRGYIQGRFRSNILSYLEAEYRFHITRNGLLGGVIFSNVQAYITKLTTGADAYAPAAGAGLRIKVNKHSGTNLCIDFGVGQNGSHGFFVNLGEVF